LAPGVTMSGMGLSLGELCCLFCCPPCPAKIAAKLAFLPPEPTYQVQEEEQEPGKSPKNIGSRTAIVAAYGPKDCLFLKL
jgi:hypothetical protein